MKKAFILLILSTLGIASISSAAPKFIPVQIDGRTYYRNTDEMNGTAYYEAYADDAGVTYVRVERFPSMGTSQPVQEPSGPSVIHQDRSGNLSVPKHQQYDPTPYNNRSGNDRTPYDNRSGNDRTPYNNRSGNDRTPYNNRSGYNNRTGYDRNSGYR
jgi:hypothetical protein